MTSTDPNILGSFQSLILPEDVQHSALKAIDHPPFLRCLIPDSSVLFRALLAVSSHASLLTALPLPNLKFLSLSAFIPDYSSPLPSPNFLPYSLPLCLGDLIHSHDLKFLGAYNF